MVEKKPTVNFNRLRPSGAWAEGKGGKRGGRKKGRRGTNFGDFFRKDADFACWFLVVVFCCWVEEIVSCLFGMERIVFKNVCHGTCVFAIWAQLWMGCSATSFVKGALIEMSRKNDAGDHSCFPSDEAGQVKFGSGWSSCIPYYCILFFVDMVESQKCLTKASSCFFLFAKPSKQHASRLSGWCWSYWLCCCVAAATIGGQKCHGGGLGKSPRTRSQPSNILQIKPQLAHDGTQASSYSCWGDNLNG